MRSKTLKIPEKTVAFFYVSSDGTVVVRRSQMIIFQHDRDLPVEDMHSMNLTGG
ncbi:MAG: hypothetical protein ACLUVM_18550 [Blautia faecis]